MKEATAVKAHMESVRGGGTCGGACGRREGACGGRGGACGRRGGACVVEAHVEECVQRRHMWRRHTWRSVQWTWKSIRQTWRSVCGGEPRGGACAKEALEEKAHTEERARWRHT